MNVAKLTYYKLANICIFILKWIIQHFLYYKLATWLHYKLHITQNKKGQEQMHLKNEFISGLGWGTTGITE
jgi:hypothetical protein